MKYSSNLTCRLILLILAILIASVANAQSSGPVLVTQDFPGDQCVPTDEICGDGVDQDCDGADLLCPGPDRDRDGYVDSQDCDDTNRWIYPGIYTQCEAECGQGVRTCQSSGSFSSCTCTPLCEATGGGKCYYVSALTGSDSNPGTFARPFKTFLNLVSYYNCSADCPAGAVTLKAGDVVYFQSGVYSETYKYYEPGDSSFFLRNVHGTPDHPIRIKAYPGAKAVISPRTKSIGIYLLQSSHFEIEGIEVTRGYGAGIRLSSTKGVKIWNVNVHHVDGDKNDNTAGVYFSSAEDVLVQNSYIHDNVDLSSVGSNPGGHGNRNVSLFSGGNIRLTRNVIFHSRPQRSGCVLYKHSQTVSDAVYEADHNILWNCEDISLGSGSYNSKIHHNLIVDSAPISFRDFGGPTFIRNIEVTNNTIVRPKSEAIHVTPTLKWGAPLGTVKMNKNVVVASGGAALTVFNIGHYSDDELYLAMIPNGLLQSDQNCISHDGTGPRFSLFGAGGSYGDLGGVYSFNQWKGFGFDQNSVNGNPQLDEYHRATLPACYGKGWNY